MLSWASSARNCPIASVLASQLDGDVDVLLDPAWLIPKVDRVILSLFEVASRSQYLTYYIFDIILCKLCGPRVNTKCMPRTGARSLAVRVTHSVYLSSADEAEALYRRALEGIAAKRRWAPITGTPTLSTARADLFMFTLVGLL
jgi:hypothetical protein